MNYDNLKNQIASYPNFVLNEEVWNCFLLFMRTFNIDISSNYSVSTFKDSLGKIYDIDIQGKKSSKENEVNVRVIFDKFGNLEIHLMKDNNYSLNLILKPDEMKFNLDVDVIDSKGAYDLGFTRKNNVIDGEFNYFDNREFHKNRNSVNESHNIDFDFTDAYESYRKVFEVVKNFLKNPEIMKKVIKEGHGKKGGSHEKSHKQI